MSSIFDESPKQQGKVSVLAVGVAALSLGSLYFFGKNSIREEKKAGILENSTTMDHLGNPIAINGRFIPKEPEDEQALENFRSVLFTIHRISVSPDQFNNRRALVIFLDSLGETRQIIDQSYSETPLSSDRRAKAMLPSLRAEFELISAKLGLNQVAKDGTLNIGAMDDEEFTSRVNKIADMIHNPSSKDLKAIGLRLCTTIAPDLAELSARLSDPNFASVIPSAKEIADWRKPQPKSSTFKLSEHISFPID